MINNLVTLKAVVEEYMLISERPEINWAKLKTLALRAYQDLCAEILPQGKVIVKSTMDSNFAIDFPADLRELNAVYIPDITGELFALSYNPKITPTYTGVNRDSDNNEGLDVPHPGGWYFSSTGGVNLAGYYTLDWENRRILFVNVDQSDVILDYLSTGIQDAESAYVPSETIGAIHAYIAYKSIIYKPGSNKNDVMLYKEELKREKQKLRMMKFNFENYKDWVLKTVTPSIQR